MYFTNDKESLNNQRPKLENLGLDNPNCYRIQETDCADVASVDTCLNVKRFDSNCSRSDLTIYGLNHLIKQD